MGVEFQTHPIMNIKRNIIFALESRKKNGVPIVENVPIRMRVIFASQRIEFTTGYRIDVSKWDADKQRVKNGCTNKLKQSAAEINTDLLKYYAEIQNIFKEFEVQEVMPTTQQLKEAFNMRMKDTSEEQPEEAPVSFWEVFDPQMVPALELQERTSSEHCIRYVQTETENHLEKSNLPDLG